MNYLLAIRSFLLFGSIRILFLYQREFKKLNKTIDNSNHNHFDAETTYNNFLRIDERLLYGHELNYEQRLIIDKLYSENIPESKIRGIVLGNYLDKNGKLKYRPIFEAFLGILGFITVTLLITLLFYTTIDLLNLNINIATKLSVVFSIFLFLIIPIYVLGNYTMTPQLSILKIINKINLDRITKS